MLQTNTRLSRAIGVALALGAGVTMAPAQAQEQADDNPTELRAVEVVGSRIKSTDAETSQPVLTLDREQIQAHGRTTVGEVIQSITASGAVANSNINSGGSGQ
ncbi:MAG: TonB-dependent receptor, partial [Luteimonas sp.]